MRRLPVSLTIAGSDSGGGAGIQADLKTFAFLKVHGTSAITCVTAQNTLGVMRVDALPSVSVTAQIMAVVDDIGIQAVKTGMLLNASIIQTVSQQIRLHGLSNVVIDPVMVSRSGVLLVDREAIEALKTHLLPHACVVTPNRYEAQILSGLEIADLATMKAAAQTIFELGPLAVLIKGGAMGGSLRGVDVWWDGHQIEVLKTQTVDTTDTHGTGCTLSAAIAAHLALGYPPLDAVRQAKVYVTQALKHSLRIGRGQGPVGHFFALL